MVADQVGATPRIEGDPTRAMHVGCIRTPRGRSPCVRLLGARIPPTVIDSEPARGPVPSGLERLPRIARRPRRTIDQEPVAEWLTEFDVDCRG